MSKLDDFLKKPAEDKPKPIGIDWEASVRCHYCNEFVENQKLYPTEELLVWICSQGHKSILENYKAF